MNIKIIIPALIIFVLTIGAFIFISQGKADPSQTNQTEQLSQANQNESLGQQAQGEMLAGTVSLYKEFTKAEYDKAVSEGKVIFLNFYANWCPVCRAEEPDLFSGFNSLNNPNVVGFRVNYKDDDTDEAEGALALEHGITYQHSKVIISDGSVVYREIAERWNSDKVVSELSSR